MRKIIFFSLMLVILVAVVVQARIYNSEVGTIFTPYTGNDAVNAMSKQLFSKQSFGVVIDPPKGNSPFVITPDNKTKYFVGEDVLCMRNETTGENFSSCWMEYEFMKEGIYLFGNNNQSRNETSYNMVVHVEDSLGIAKIKYQIKLILERLGWSLDISTP